jgi:hypothetical protein
LYHFGGLPPLMRWATRLNTATDDMNRTKL